MTLRVAFKVRLTANLTLREKLTQITLVDATYSEHVDASIEWQFWVHEYINVLLKPFLKLGKARLP